MTGLSFNDNDDVKIKGATDGTLIGNVGDLLKVFAEVYYSYSNLTGNATTTVKSGAGILRAIILNNNTTGGTFTVYDNTAGSGTKIATLKAGTPSGGLLSTTGQQSSCTIQIDAAFSTGLTIVSAGSTSNDITVLYL